MFPVLQQEPGDLGLVGLLAGCVQAMRFGVDDDAVPVQQVDLYGDVAVVRADVERFVGREPHLAVVGVLQIAGRDHGHAVDGDLEGHVEVLVVLQPCISDVGDGSRHIVAAVVGVVTL